MAGGNQLAIKSMAEDLKLDHREQIQQLTRARLEPSTAGLQVRRADHKVRKVRTFGCDRVKTSSSQILIEKGDSFSHLMPLLKNFTFSLRLNNGEPLKLGWQHQLYHSDTFTRR